MQAIKRLALALLILTAWVPALHAQEASGRALTLIVGAGPAGLTDLLARAIAPSLSRALLGREVEFSLVSRSVGLAQIRGGALRPVVSWSQQRWEQLPEVPNLKDEGYALGYDLVTGLFAPAATPAAVSSHLRAAVRNAVADPQFRSAMEKMSAQITYYDAPEFGALWDRESARPVGVVRRIGRIE